MAFRDLLLQMNSHSVPTPQWAIEAAARLAARHDARLSAALCHVHIPAISNVLADMVASVGDAIAAANAQSNSNAKALLQQFAAIVGPARMGEEILIECQSMVTPRDLAARARAYDLTILPKYGHPETDFVAEGLVFESGRPVLLLPQPGGSDDGFESIVIGWDGSRAGARALADAMPFCQRARSVELAAVTEDKPLGNGPSLSDARRHLASHGIDSREIEVPSAGLDAGASLLRHCAAAEADLLVMGAYGHSRFREFVLGGATRAAIAEAALPILLSH